jgi:hypothetical protein
MLIIANNLGVLPVFLPQAAGKDYELSPYLTALANSAAISRLQRLSPGCHGRTQRR